MKVTITPTKLSGAITPPPSKSQAHRLIIAAALGGGISTISNVARSQDITATLSCLGALGMLTEWTGEDQARLHGLGNSIPQMGPVPYFDCGESGSTLRFLIPIALAVVGGGVFTGRGRLMERPQKPYFDLFDEKGIIYEQKDGGLTVQGTLPSGEYRLPGDVSSQFITGLLYALPLLEGDSEIVLTTPLESRDYVAMTLDVLKQFGITVERQGFARFRIPGNQRYLSRDTAIEADWSQAGFWYAAAGIGNDVTVTGMNERSIQGDRIIVDYGRMIDGKPLSGGVKVPIYRGVEGETPPPIEPVQPPRGGHSASLDVSPCPDLVPPLAVWGALMNGALYIKNAARLRIKESDRLASVTATLNAMGARVKEGPDCLTIIGQTSLAGGVTVDCCNDHRIAMMAAIAVTRCEQPVTLLGAECVNKSYPSFWEDYQHLGGNIQIIDD